MAQQGAYGQFPQPHAEYSTDTVIYKGGPPNNGMRGPLPNTEEEFPPPPPERGNGSNDNSLNDSNSTTQSNVTSECSEAECDREPLVKPGTSGNRASVGSPRDMTTEEMRKLLERNEIVGGTGGSGL